MTEQEKREKAIEEMAEMVEVFTRGVCSTRQGVIDALERGGYSDIKNLYEAGYRKEEEVKKETAKSLINRLLQFCENIPHYVDIKDLIKVAQEFGVEVEK